MAKRSLSRPLPPRPTNAELEILRVLWARGPCTVRAVRESFDRAEPIGYTTVLKLLQIMTEKGLVRRDESLRSHVYSAAVSEGSTQRRMVADLVKRAFGGSTLQLLLHALSATPATPWEVNQIRKLLNQKNGARA
ncbi:MAG TPA: BlaI/MecI/CopY family transcriptional regulator [Gemmatimonadales bacterium]|nr:BlaI/MecI/CopY family transcriptional regulator [Gemmatimonadales bacterium]